MPEAELSMDSNILNYPGSGTILPIQANGGDEEELVRLSREGNIDAFGELSQRYEQRLFNLLRKLLRNTCDAEDIAQDTFLKAFRNLNQFRQGMPFGPWLFRIGTNLALDELRRRKPSVNLDEIDDHQALHDPRQESPRAVLDQKQTQQLVDQELAQLPPETAAIINLRYRDEMSIEDIARMLSRPPGTIAVLIHRTRETLRRRIFDRQENRPHE